VAATTLRSVIASHESDSRVPRSRREIASANSTRAVVTSAAADADPRNASANPAQSSSHVTVLLAPPRLRRPHGDPANSPTNNQVQSRIATGR